jgi:superfamily II DNA helicase RecQ
MPNISATERDDFFALLASMLGFQELRPAQKDAIIEIVFKRRDSYLGVPTDWGKTALPLAAALFSLDLQTFKRKEGSFPALIIVPSQVIDNRTLSTNTYYCVLSTV